MVSKKVTVWPAGRPYLAGDFYSFQTTPEMECGPKETGRFAAIKVFGFEGEAIGVALLDCIFENHPTLEQVKNLPVMRQRRFNFQGTLAVCFVGIDYENDLEDFKYLGTCPTSPADTALLTICRSYSAWTWASFNAEGEWLWKHDRPAYEQEVRLKHEAFLARIAAERERLKTRLKTLTWGALLAETPFSRWDSHPPFPPPEFVTAAREQIHSAARALQALGPKPRRAEVRTILKSCVEWFNGKDAEFGGVIETEEREDICAALEELAFVARQKGLVAEIDEWRDW
jgi:hypothetical protein